MIPSVRSRAVEVRVFVGGSVGAAVRVSLLDPRGVARERFLLGFAVQRDADFEEGVDAEVAPHGRRCTVVCI